MIEWRFTIILWVFVVCTAQGTVVSGNVDDVCPDLASFSCPAIPWAENGRDVLQLVPKRMRKHHLMANHPMLQGMQSLICEKPDCLSDPCLNGGTCAETLDGFRCSCWPNYSGNRCESPSCPSGWLLGEGKCYTDASFQQTWQDARAYCEGLGPISVYGQPRYPVLLMIESEAELSTFRGLYPDVPIWLNCHDPEGDVTFVCETDRNGTTTAFRHWRPGQPNGPGTERCLLLGTDGFHDFPCSSPFISVCQISVV